MMSITTLLALSAANCWLGASSAFDVPPGLLLAVAQVESAYQVDALALAPNGTHSVGLMQINSSWFPQLRRAGISEEGLYEPCTNINVGAWILSQNIARYGATWEAIGAYYAGPYDAKSHAWKLPLYRQYATKVFRAWKRINEASAALLAKSAQRSFSHQQGSASDSRHGKVQLVEVSKSAPN
jgi:soluble lytic murein transglycosylase-like protein